MGAAEDRPDPVAILEEQARTRVPDLVPIRHGRMAASPFAYFRGAAGAMAWDLAHTPTTDIRVQACGDAHLLNFGMFAAPDRRLVFDVNDFDETLPAPFEWDVKRLAASFAVAARDNGFPDRDAHTAARLAVRSYRTEMANYAAMRFLKVWYSRIDIDEVSRLSAALEPKEGRARRGGWASGPARALLVKRGSASVLRVVCLEHQFVEGTGVAVGVVEHQVACGIGADRQAEERSGGLVRGQIAGGDELASRGDHD